MKVRNNKGTAFEKRMLSWEEAQIYTGLGKATCRKLCENIGAVKKYGSRVLFDRLVIDRHFDQIGADE